jgi:hypothetical protein
MKRLPPALAGLAALLCVSAVASAGPALSGDPQPPGETSAFEDRLARAELLAGLTPVEGPGLIVRLRHSPRAAPKGVDPKTLRVQEQDFNAILNVLRAAGAEALAVGGQGPALERVLAGSAAREHGVGLLVNAAFLAPPYQIQAIGERTRLRQELLRADGIVKKTGLDVLQMIEVQDADLLVLPAARATELRFARLSTGLVQTILAQPEPTVLPARPMAAPGTVGGVVRRPAPAPAVKPPPMAEPPVRVEPLPAPKSPEKPPVVEKPAEPLPVVEKPALKPTPPVAKPAARVFGGRGLAKYHQAGCRYGERIEPAERVHFATPQEAAQKGRTPCPVCHTDQPGR